MKTLTQLALGCSAALLAAASIAAPIYATPDTFLFSAKQVGGNNDTNCAPATSPDEQIKGSGDTAEALCLSQFLGLGTPLTTDIKDASFNFVYNGLIGGVDSWYIDVDPNEPGYFLLKYGDGNTTSDSHFFFENDPILTKLVFTNTQVNGLMNGCNAAGGAVEGDVCSNSGLRLSHFATYGGTSSTSSTSSTASNTSVTVPEPNSSALVVLALGLLAAGFYRRSKG
jgi:hypothetical protein